MQHAHSILRASRNLCSAILSVALASLTSLAHAADVPVPTPRSSGVFLHIDGPRGLELQHDLDSMHADHDPQRICVTPCDRVVASDLRYRLAGGGIKRSEEFTLQAPDGGHERIGVRGGSKAWFLLGWIGIGVGGGSALVGLEVLLVPVLSANVPGADGRVASQPTAGHPALGWSLVGGGLALGAASARIMLAQRTTTVTQDTASTPTRPSREEPNETAADRKLYEETWPRALVAPLVFGTF